MAFAGISTMMDAMRSTSPISSFSERLQEAQHLQALEGNPLREAEEVAQARLTALSGNHLIGGRGSFASPGSMT